MQLSTETCLLKLKLASLSIPQLRYIRQARSVDDIKTFMARSKEIRTMLDDVVKSSSLRILSSVSSESEVLVLRCYYERLNDRVDDTLKRLFNLNTIIVTDSIVKTPNARENSTIGLLIKKGVKEFLTELENELSKSESSVNQQRNHFHAQISLFNALIEVIESQVKSSPQEHRIEKMNQIIEFLKAEKNSFEMTASTEQSSAVMELHRTRKLLHRIPGLLISQLEEARTQQEEATTTS